MDEVIGWRELDAMFQRLAEEGAKKALRAGVGAAMKPISQALRAAVDASGAPKEVKRQAKKLIGRRFDKKGGRKKNEVRAKVGFAVGKQSQKKKLTAHERYQAYKAGGAKGVGISSSDIHWFVLGTQQRATKAGHRTGKIPPELAGVLEQATAGAMQQSLAAARAKIDEVITREAAKR
jgi:hypothetical protein